MAAHVLHQGLACCGSTAWAWAVRMGAARWDCEGRVEPWEWEMRGRVGAWRSWSWVVVDFGVAP